MTVIGNISRQIGVVGVISIDSQVNAIASAEKPNPITGLGWLRSTILPTNGASTPVAIAIGAVSKLITMNVTKMREARDASVAMAAHTRAWLVVGAAAGLICAFGVLGWIALYQISRPLAFMTDEMTKLANGDLGIQIEGADRADARPHGIGRPQRQCARGQVEQVHAQAKTHEEATQPVPGSRARDLARLSQAGGEAHFEKAGNDEQKPVHG